MKLLFLGAPGSGKGTYAQKLVKDLNVPQISTGDIFRKNLKEETPLGLKIKGILAAGQLVPDDVTVEIVKDRLAQDDCKNGFILDGFPRTIAQADALAEFEQIDFAVYPYVPNEVVIARLAGRRFCPDCNGTFHVATLGGSAICPNCGGKLIVRDDDREETVKARIEVYEQTTFPLIEYYEKSGKLLKIDGNGTVDEVYGRILRALGK